MIRFFAFLGIFLPCICFAQNDPIFEDLSGNPLLNELVESYKPVITNSYGEARDILFGIIDKNNGAVECIYSGHQINLPNGVDPTEFLFQNGTPNGINTEHTFPQSMGAGFGQARVDLHHLFPARVAVNTARGSLPFTDISDFETDTWYYLNQEQGNIPSNNKDAYSEGTNAQFEPRESVKGDIARAMFYFYTMYKNQADNENSTFFSSQQSRLCQWHYQDPADQNEINRTNLIAVYQDNLPNPFVLDCTLAARCYCEPNPACPIITSTSELDSRHEIKIFPNPVKNQTVQIDFGNNEVGAYRFNIWSPNGSAYFTKMVQYNGQATHVDLSNLAPSIYFYQILNAKGSIVSTSKLLIL